MSSRSTALIIGAGLGGIATAARLTTERILKEVGVVRPVEKPIAQLNWSEL